MQSQNAMAGNTGKFAVLMIFGGIALAVFIFFMDTRVQGEEPKPNRLAEDIADIEDVANMARNSITGALSEGQIGQQLANLQAQLPSADSLIPDQPTPIVVDPPQQPGAPPVIQPVSEVVYPTPTPLPPPTPIPVAVQPTQAPVDLASAPTYHVAVLSDGRKHIMTTQRIYMACSDMFMEYGGHINMQYGYPLFSWFSSLTNEERGVYYYQCTSN